MTTPSPVIWCIRIVIVFQCVGTAWSIFQYGTSINTFLYIYQAYPESFAMLVDRISGWVMLIAAAGILIFLSWWFAVPVSVWTLSEALAKWSVGSLPYPWISLFSPMARYVAPIALMMLVGNLRVRREPALWLLRFSIGATFAAHGLEAHWHYPVFIDYLISAGDRLLDMNITESQARSALTVIGMIDLVLAVLIVTRRWRWVAAYMAWWGLVTAASRIVHFGWTAWFELCIRMAHVGIPLALLYYWHLQLKTKPIG